MNEDLQAAIQLLMRELYIRIKDGRLSVHVQTDSHFDDQITEVASALNNISKSIDYLVEEMIDEKSNR